MEERWGRTQKDPAGGRNGTQWCERAAGSAEDSLGLRHRGQEVRCWTRQEGWGGTAKPRSGPLASRAGFGTLPRDAGTKEELGSPLENSLSCSGKRTSWEAGDDDPSRLGPQLETRSQSPIARTSGSLKLASPRQPPPPSCIRGAVGHFRCRPRLGRRASCACADGAGLVGAGVAGRMLGFGLVSASRAFLLSPGAGSATLSALPHRLGCPQSQRARSTRYTLDGRGETLMRCQNQFRRKGAHSNEVTMVGYFASPQVPTLLKGKSH